MRIHKDVSDLINLQINHELGAAYTYLGMAAYFETEDLPGLPRGSVAMHRKKRRMRCRFMISSSRVTCT